MGQSCTKPRPDGTTVAIVDLLLGSWGTEPCVLALRARIGVGVGVKACLPAPIVKEKPSDCDSAVRIIAHLRWGGRTSTGARRRADTDGQDVDDEVGDHGVCPRQHARHTELQAGEGRLSPQTTA